MIKRLLRNVWLLFFIIAIFIFLFSTYQTITFSSIGAPQFAVYSIGPLLIIGSSYLHLNYVTKLISLIQIIIYLAIAVVFIKLPEMLEEYGHFLLFPVITNFYSSWCALIWHTNSKIRKLAISIVSVFYIFSLTTVLFGFSNDILNKITLILAILSLLISIISSFFLRKFVKAKVKPEIKSEEKEAEEDPTK
jgi:preprotein translocase subunit SecG